MKINIQKLVMVWLSLPVMGRVSMICGVLLAVVLGGGAIVAKNVSDVKLQQSQSGGVAGSEKAVKSTSTTGVKLQNNGAADSGNPGQKSTSPAVAGGAKPSPASATGAGTSSTGAGGASTAGTGTGITPAPSGTTGSGGGAVVPAPPKYLFGVLGSGTAHITTMAQAGVTTVLLGLAWDQYETTDGGYNATYKATMLNRAQQYKAAGYKVVLDFGVQYPPSWIFGIANSRYVNQFGDSYNPNSPGKNVANSVFNATVRAKQGAYMQQVLQDMGSLMYGVRLGGGWYGELNYPDASFNGHGNSYWGYDSVAQGSASGLAAGVTASPVPGWQPGNTSAGHTNASQFSNWYMNCLLNYQNWQISTVRASYSGKLAVLYPSWGIRPGQLAGAVNVDLNGSTSAEVNGEVQRGFDFARYVAGITDTNSYVYTTWLDADNSNDGGANQAIWSPVHYLKSLASANTRVAGAWGENTGGNNLADMQRAVNQMKTYNLLGLMWAFEDQLYTGQYATLADYQLLISQNQ